MGAADEQPLLQRAREGDRSAFRMLVERHIRGAYDVAYGFVRDRDIADDIVQDAFLRAFDGLGGFRGDARFSTWLHRIVVNLSLNRVKRERTKAAREVPILTAMPLAVTAGVDGSAADVRSHLERALHELPTLQRAVVILRHYEGLSTEQVSRILQCSEGTVKTHLFRGLRKMREKLHFLKDDAE
jgi:RNA polymerase sigma-70 factor (ECF subfamily)